MKRILMAMVVAVGIAVAIPFAPVQVQEAEARPDCVAVDHNDDGYTDITDVSMVAGEPGGQGRVIILLQHFGEAC